uniref:Tubulin epsilon and delta complex protein 1 domain-containing protein n=1 Tax=Clastoptera arizonana TaxID=38151 RepID=A0A1B6E399_9HEMI
MSDFKGSIIMLCEVINSITSTNLKPEYFRLAKFNNDSSECREAFWQVLHNFCSHTISKNCEDDRTACIQKNISLFGYKYAHRITSDLSAHELLLILGWLLSKDILEIVINQHIYQSSFFLEIENKHVVYEPIMNLDNDKATSQFQTIEDNMNYILLLAGKIRLNMKNIGSCLEERAKLCGKIHEGTIRSNGLPHLSTFEAKLIQDPSLVSVFLAEVDHCKLLLESYSKWKKKNHNFWEWMVSVLRETEKNILISRKHEEHEEEFLKEYLLFLKKEVKEIIMSEIKDKPLDTNCQQILCKRMIFIANDSSINHKISHIDSEIKSLEKVCKAKERELHQKLERLLVGTNISVKFK